jgi:hypothetical protein
MRWMLVLLILLAITACNRSPPPLKTTRIKIRPDVTTLAIVEVVKKCPEYKPIDAAFQEEGSVRALGNGCFSITGTIKGDGKPDRSYVVEVRDDRPDGELYFLQIQVK